MFPLGIAVALVLALCRCRRLALAWTLAIGSVWTAMLVLKLAGYTLEALMPASPLSELGFVTPSGHVASASSIYGGLIRLLAGTGRRRTILAALLIAVIIGVSRVDLGEHTPAEVIVGALVGVAGTATFAGLVETGLGRRCYRAVLGISVFVVVLLHGVHFSWEQAIRGLSLDAVRTWQSSHSTVPPGTGRFAAASPTSRHRPPQCRPDGRQRPK